MGIIMNSSADRTGPEIPCHCKGKLKGDRYIQKGIIPLIGFLDCPFLAGAIYDKMT